MILTLKMQVKIKAWRNNYALQHQLRILDLTCVRRMLDIWWGEITNFTSRKGDKRSTLEQDSEEYFDKSC